MSSTFEHPAWANATLLKGDVVTEVSKLKRERDGDIVVYASSQRIGQPPHLSAPVLLPRREEPPPTAPVLTPPRRQVISAWLDLQVTAALTGSAYVALLVGGL